MAQQFGRSKRTNSPLPYSSKLLQRHWVEHSNELHHQRLEAIARTHGPNAADSRWGVRDHAGVSDPRRQTYAHLRDNLKREQLEEERYSSIDSQNRSLVGRLGKLAVEAPIFSPERAVELKPFVRLSPAQHPRISPPGSRGAQGSPDKGSLNAAFRKAEAARIARENYSLAVRIHATHTAYSQAQMLAQRRQVEYYLGSMTDFPERCARVAACGTGGRCGAAWYGPARAAPPHMLVPRILPSSRPPARAARPTRSRARARARPRVRANRAARRPRARSRLTRARSACRRRRTRAGRPLARSC